MKIWPLDVKSDGHLALSSAEVLAILQKRKKWKEPLPYNTGVMVPVVF